MLIRLYLIYGLFGLECRQPEIAKEAFSRKSMRSFEFKSNVFGWSARISQHRADDA